MTKKSIFILIIAFIFIVNLPNLDFPINEKNIIGTYIEEYYIPPNSTRIMMIDTLTIFENGRLKSNRYGNGTYEYTDDFTKPNRILLIPEKGKNAMTYSAKLTNVLFRNITIEMSGTADWHRYKKFE